MSESKEVLQGKVAEIVGITLYAGFGTVKVLNDLAKDHELMDKITAATASGRTNCPTFGDFEVNDPDCQLCGKEAVILHLACMKAFQEKQKSQTRTVTSGPRKQNAKGAAVSFIQGMLEEAKYTRKQIVDAFVAAGLGKPSTVGTYLSDGKNPKYAKAFTHIIAEAEGRVLYLDQNRPL